MTIEEIKEFLNNDEEGKRLLDSLTDTRVSQGVETYKKKHEVGRIKELQDEINQLHADKQREQFSNIALELGVPSTLLKYSIGETEEETRVLAAGLISNLTETIKQETDREVINRLGGVRPVGGESIKEDDISTQVLKRMGV